MVYVKVPYKQTSEQS